MLLSIKKVSLGIILVIVLLALASADDDDDQKAEKEEEEKDPWDKSTDKYRHHLGDSGAGTHSEEPVKIDVTEVSESEVHSERSKVCKNCKLKNVVARKKSHSSKSPPATAAKDATKSAEGKDVAAPQYFDKNEVDDETKEQINDATDEKDPADAKYKEATSSVTKRQHKKQHHKGKKHRIAQASKKQLNPQIDYYPGNVWEYPYPYHHDIKYGCGENDQNCDAKIEAKEEAKEQGNLEALLFPNDARATPVPQEAKIESAVPPNESALPAMSKPEPTGKEPPEGVEPHPEPDHAETTPAEVGELSPEPVPKLNPIEAKGGMMEGKEGIEGKIGIEGKQDKKSKSKKKEAVGRAPDHTGHHKISEIGTSWETPCFYNADTKKFSCKQLIPSHYYGPPSAGWGGFQPGHTGGGWGTPHWNKKCSVPHKPHKNCRQLIPSHYYGPPSAGWGGFQPGHTGGGWGTPHWNKRCHTPQLKCKSYSRPSVRSSWFFYNPREKKAWDPAAWYRYKGVVPRSDSDMQGSMRYKVSRPEDTINRITPLVIAHPHMRNSVGALHEWITFLENEREKDRELERFRLQLKDRENQRRYNLDVLHYQAAQSEAQPLAVQLANEHPLKPLHRDPSRVSYYSKLPTLEEQQNYEKKTIDYVLHGGLGSTLYNDRK